MEGDEVKKSKQELYAEMLRQQAAIAAEASYTCLCCRDSALIPADIVEKYGLAGGHPFLDDYDTELKGAVGFMCNNPNCRANKVTVEVPNPNQSEGGSIRKEVDRFADWAVNTHLSPGQCKEIHAKELVLWRQKNESEKWQTIDVPAQQVSQAIAAIGKPMPKSGSQIDRNPKPILEHKGFCVGDVVQISLDAFDESDRREMRRNNEVPEGEFAQIKAFRISPVAEKIGYKAIDAVLDMGGGQELALPCMYLQHAEVAA